MSDRVAVMSQGVIEQIADGNTLYDHPQTPFVASFVGQNNALPGRVTHVADGLVTAATEVGDIRARVMGTHGSRTLRSMVFGSTARRVVRDAPCAALTVRAG
jgi:ABC-type Fe3+/spermidine/putrescine transport system ATPase subunit